MHEKEYNKSRTPCYAELKTNLEEALKVSITLKNRIRNYVFTRKSLNETINKWVYK